MQQFFTIMRPELVITLIIFLLLFLKLGKGWQNETVLNTIQVLLLLNFISGFFFVVEGSLFNGMFYTNAMITLQKNILNLAVYLLSLLFAPWLKKNEHLPEFFMLLLSALLGMFFLVSSGNFLIFFLALELATIPVAAMANLDLAKKVSSEAAMKMILSSAFSSGILLFGISIVYGICGTLRFDAVTALLDGSTLQVLAFVFLFTAFAFKLSIVPFHLWTADVYEGAPAATTVFLSVLSKGSTAFILITVLYRVFQPMQEIWHHLVVILSVATMVTGNLFAMRQQNIKRFLAFSSIAQVGFILVGISSHAVSGIAAVVFFILVYVFSNLAAFGVADLVAMRTGRERIEDYKGMYPQNKFLSWMLALALFSLAGIPPTAGFFGKLFLLAAGASAGNYWFILIAALNMILSLYYYLRIVRAIFMEKNEQAAEKIDVPPVVRFGLLVCAAGIVLLGFLGWVYEHIQSLA